MVRNVSLDPGSANIRSLLDLRKAFALVWQSGPGWTTLAGALVIAQGMVPLATLYLTKQIVDTVTNTVDAVPVGEHSLSIFIILLGLLAIVAAGIRSLSHFVRDAQAVVVADYMYGVVHKQSSELDLGYYENWKYYDILHRAQQEAPGRPLRIVNGLVEVGQSSISLGAILGVLASFHWGVALALVIAVIPGMLAQLKYVDRFYTWDRDRTPLERKAEFFDWMLVSDEYAKEIRLFGLGCLFRDRFRRLRDQLRLGTLTFASRHAQLIFLSELTPVLVVVGSIFLIATKAAQGSITLGDLVMYVGAFQAARMYLQDLVSGLSRLYEDNRFLVNLHHFLDLKPQVVEPIRPKPVPRPIQSGIEIRNVTFRYPSRDDAALQDVSLTIRSGERVALVGENGAGKTTLVKLLTRLYDPTSGAILVDGVDIREFDSSALRREISALSQDFARYELTARENVWLGDVELAPDDDRITIAARMAGADGMLRKLRAGYGTTLGTWFEGAQQLSAGEWQKVALARSLVREAQILILDEPTSALDALAEAEVVRKFENATAGRTAIVISHRLSTAMWVDRIYVLDEGRIAEKGTHRELMRDGKLYAHLFKTQGKHYQLAEEDDTGCGV